MVNPTVSSMAKPRRWAMSPTPQAGQRWAAWFALAGLVAVGGCASLNTVSNDVTSFAQWPAQRSPGTYVFDRLPSQQARAEQQSVLETAAARALQVAGFTLATDPASADVLVLTGARADRTIDVWDDPFGWRYGPYRWSRPGGYYRAGWWGPPGGSFGLGWRWEPPRYEREVALLIRDRRSGTALYETRASSDGTGGFSPALMTAMFVAALKDFPNPASGARSVRVELPKDQPAR